MILVTYITHTHTFGIIKSKNAFRVGVKTNHAISFSKVNPRFLSTHLQCSNDICSGIWPILIMKHWPLIKVFMMAYVAPDLNYIQVFKPVCFVCPLQKAAMAFDLLTIRIYGLEAG